MKTYIIKEVTQHNSSRINDLLRMLNDKVPAIGTHRLEELLKDDTFNLFAAEDENGTIAGMLTLTCCPTLLRNKYWIEDVIVDEAFRGRGAGRALVKAAVRHVRSIEESPVIYLTSNPTRTCARQLYRSEGFEEYETGVFRII